MQEEIAPSQDGAAPFTLREAATVLGVSLNTLRRRIANGQVRAEQVERPQGFVWHVHLDNVPAQEHHSNGTMQQDRPGTVQEHGAETVQEDGPGTVQHPSTGLAQAEAMAAYTRSILEPLVMRMAEQEGTIREQSEQIGTLAERLAHVEQDRERLAAALAAAEDIVVAAHIAQQPQEAPTAPSPATPSTDAQRPRWHALWPLLTFWTAAALVVVVIGVLLFWPR
jgi:hypothetical protein